MTDYYIISTGEKLLAIRGRHEIRPGPWYSRAFSPRALIECTNKILSTKFREQMRVRAISNEWSDAQRKLIMYYVLSRIFFDLCEKLELSSFIDTLIKHFGIPEYKALNHLFFERRQLRYELINWLGLVKERSDEYYFVNQLNRGRLERTQYKNGLFHWTIFTGYQYGLDTSCDYFLYIHPDHIRMNRFYSALNDKPGEYGFTKDTALITLPQAQTLDRTNIYIEIYISKDNPTSELIAKLMQFIKETFTRIAGSRRKIVNFLLEEPVDIRGASLEELEFLALEQESKNIIVSSTLSFEEEMKIPDGYEVYVIAYRTVSDDVSYLGMDEVWLGNFANFSLAMDHVNIDIKREDNRSENESKRNVRKFEDYKFGLILKGNKPKIEERDDNAEY